MKKGKAKLCASPQAVPTTTKRKRSTPIVNSENNSLEEEGSNYRNPIPLNSVFRRLLSDITKTPKDVSSKSPSEPISSSPFSDLTGSAISCKFTNTSYKVNAQRLISFL